MTKKSTHFWVYADESLTINHSETSMGRTLKQEIDSIRETFNQVNAEDIIKDIDGQEYVIYEIREVKRFKVKLSAQLEEVK